MRKRTLLIILLSVITFILILSFSLKYRDEYRTRLTNKAFFQESRQLWEKRRAEYKKLEELKNNSTDLNEISNLQIQIDKIKSDFVEEQFELFKKYNRQE